jgi:hypothetical protein
MACCHDRSVRVLKERVAQTVIFRMLFGVAAPDKALQRLTRSVVQPPIPCGGVEATLGMSRSRVIATAAQPIRTATLRRQLSLCERHAAVRSCARQCDQVRPQLRRSAESDAGALQRHHRRFSTPLAACVSHPLPNRLSDTVWSVFGLKAASSFPATPTDFAFFSAKPDSLWL